MLIYLIENTINNKVYIGQTTSSLKQRIASHKSYAVSCKRKNLACKTVIASAISKYGIENFKFSIIDTASTQEELDKAEIWWIAIFNSTNREIGYNISPGGTGVGKISKETKRKLSLLRLELWKSEEYRQHMSEVHKGQIGWNKGLIMPKEHCQKLSEAHKGQRNNSSSAFKKGQHMSPSTEFKKGQIPWNKGLKTGVSLKKMFTEDQEKEIAIKYQTGNFTQKQLSKEYNCSIPTIANAIKKYNLQDRG